MPNYASFAMPVPRKPVPPDASSALESSKPTSVPPSSVKAACASACRSSHSRYWPICWSSPEKWSSREDLRQSLWPSDTFVDFDHSLNTAVNKLREALGDSASSPRYVETLARRGYRFVAPVQVPEPAAVATPNSPSTDHPELEVPLPNRGLMRGLFGLIQIMYLIFYLSALFHLPDLDRITESFVPGWKASALFVAVIVTAGVGIILRCYLLSAVSFDYGRLRANFERLFLAILPLDQLWAVSPFLITEKIGFGAAFAATAALLYVPFAERTLLRMAYPKVRNR